MADGSQARCDTEVDFSLISQLCGNLPQPQLMTSVFTQWMRMHFSDVARINIDILQDYVWTEDITTTGIVIDSVYMYNPAQSEYRPGIYVKRNPWKVDRRGIDDRHMLSVNYSGPPQYTTFFQCSHTVFCVAGEAAETELLATEVYRELVMSSPRARKVFKLLRIGVSDIGEVSLLEEATENFVVPITVAYGGELTWQICC